MMYQAGSKVKGTYFGIEYEGIVREYRPHTIHPTRVEYFVDLILPIKVYGTERISINVGDHDPREGNTIMGA